MKIFIHLLILFVLTGCVSSTKYLKRGDYDNAVVRSVQKLRKNRTKEKEIKVLREAYPKANESDISRINFLKKEGSPAMWDELFNLYCELNARQTLVKSVLPLKLNGKAVNFNMVDYDMEIITAKQNAAEYFYAKGLKFLENNDRQSARQAYGEFVKVKEFYSDFKDIDVKLKEALNKGTSYVLFRMNNKSGILIPKEFEEELLKISLSDVNSRWVVYHTKGDPKDYDYTILYNIRTIVVSPEAVREVHFNETKEVPDGFSYQLDSKGNVMKDSLGNDIKIPKTKIIGANIVELHKSKKAMVSGTLDFIDNKTNQLIKTDPVTAETFFENISAAAFGDLNALKPETRKRLSAPNLPFPPDGALIMQSSAIVKDMVKGIIFNHKTLLK